MIESEHLETLPLSYAQQRLWFLHKLEGPSATYNMPFALQLDGPLNISALRGALEDLIDRHESLHTVFPEINGRPVQHILSSQKVVFSFEEVSLDSTSVLAKAIDSAAGYCFDLKCQIPLRATLFHLTPCRHVLVLLFHHIACDGGSLPPLCRDLAIAYTARREGGRPAFAQLPVQYADYTLWQRELLGNEGDPTSLIAQQFAYWKSALAGLPEQVSLPADRPRPPIATYRGSNVSFWLERSLHIRLLALARNQRMTLSMVLQASLAALLSRLGAGYDIPLGCSIAGRSDNSLIDLVGFFVNTWVLRVDTAGDPSFKALLTQVRERALDAYMHQDAPFDRLVDLLNPVRSAAHHPLFQVSLTLQNNDPSRFEMSGINVSELPTHTHTSKFDLFINLCEIKNADGQPNGIQGDIEFAADLFDQGSIDAFAQRYVRFLESVSLDPDQSIGRVDLLSHSERQSLLYDWNKIDAPYPEDFCIHQLFEQQVEGSPDAIALVYEEASLTYAELNARANRLAHHLIQLGVRPETRVAICVDRSPAMVVGLLAILKAGGAYVPLDPAYPSERLVHILADAAPALVLADTSGRVALGEPTLAMMTTIDPNATLYHHVDTNPCVTDLTSCHLAYVIYTSGSTGMPKGVMVEHRQIVRLFDATNIWYRFDSSDTWCLFHSFAFDFSVWELWGALRYGGNLVLVSHATARSPRAFHRLVCKQGVTVLNLTPTAFKMFIASSALNSMPDRLRYVILSGEALEPSTLRPWYALHSGESPQLVNMYGITETTVFVTYRPLTPEDANHSQSPIGIRISDMGLYLLDQHGQPVPSGAIGELYIGGAGVARGYLNQPELTAERFLPDPFSPHPGARMYRSGDLARYLPDGNLVFLGRNDHQVKIRGFRIEPGEIEARLLEHSEIRDAVVLALGDDSSKRLVAYVVRNEGRAVRDLAREVQQVTEWQAVYQAEYRKSRDDDWDEDFHGWISSYDGQAIPHKQMLEWQAATVNRLLELQPCHVLEIGVGGGLILSQLAPHCETYCGTDFSNEAIARLGAQIERHTNFDKRVSLVCQPAHLTKDLPIQRFDTIVLNSVVQYFPSAEYLIEVIQQAFSRLDPGGALFIGDIRSLPLLRCFASAVQFAKANEATDPIELQWAIDRQIKMDKELVLDPGFFVKLQHDIKDVAGVDIRVKRGRSSNELNRYRYDVVLYKSPIEIQSAMALPTISWDRNVNNLDILATYLGDTNLDGLRFCCVPNFHLIHEVKALELFRRKLPLASVLKQFRIAEDVPHPEDFHEIGAKFDFRVVVTWSGDSQNGDIDVLFLRRPLAFLTDVYRSTDNHQNTALLANEPYRLEDNRRLVADLEATLATQIPQYMVPAAFVVLDNLPLTLNGKLDRKALPDPDGEAFARQIYEAPQGEIESTLATLWSELLGVTKVSRHDTFFALGGHSLLAVRLINRVAKTWGVEPPLASLFASASLAAFAEVIGEQLKGQQDLLPPITPVAREGVLPLSFAQQRLWFLAQLEGVSATYHIPMALRLRGPLDTNAWQQALDTLFARHEALRSTFLTVDGQAHVQLLDARSGLPMRRHDLRGVGEMGRQAELERLRNEETYAPFDLVHGPLIRTRLIQLHDEEHVFLLTQHHIVSDGWSIGVMTSELNALYTAYHAAQPNPLPPLAIQYPDYAAWQRQWFTGDRLQAQADYWRATLADAPALLELPIDHPRDSHKQSFTGASMPFHIDATLTQALKHLSQRHGTTLFMTFLAAWSVVLARLSGQDDLVIGSPSANRGRHEIEPLIGFFVNTLALRLDLSGAPTVAELLRRVRQRALEAQDHQDLPFEQVVEIVQPPRRLEHTPIFQVMFAWQNKSLEHNDWHLQGLDVSSAEITYDAARFDLDLNLAETDDTILCNLRYASDIFDSSTIERQIGYLQTTLRAMVADDQQLIIAIDILAPVERELLLQTWNATDAPYPEHLCIHQLFEQQVERSPDAIALVYEEESLTYAELNARANRLAHHLIQLGVRPDICVAICVERSPAMVVGLLAILKAGGAYVPLDPAYPSERLVHILADAAPALVLADTSGRAALGEPTLAMMTAIDPNATLYHHVDTNPYVPGLTSRHLAYVIYTSGSTGVPKGPLNEHRGLINRLVWMQNTYQLRSFDRVLQKTPFSFDVSVWEFFWTLLNGATLVIAMPNVHKDVDALLELIIHHGITTIHFVPSMLHVFLQGKRIEYCTSLRRLICSGEVLVSTHVRLSHALLPNAQLSNLFGPTEAAIDVSAWLCPQDYTGDIIPIGRPISNVRIYLLNGGQQPVPFGAVGELYIGGVGVARGYLNQPELTAERFLPDPFSPHPGACMYRSGDLARYLPDGNLVFLGRNDHQVKIRGFRIEPGEIEARLLEHPEIRDAVVLALGDDTSRHLVAYVVAKQSGSLANSMREFLSARLPEYMVPAAFVVLDNLPLTLNGKLDRKALPNPDGEAFARQIYEAPQGENESLLATLWSELLGVTKVSRHDTFFALGGHSLLAVRLINRVAKTWGVEPPLASLFASASLAAFAAVIGEQLKGQQDLLPPITPVAREGVLPLSFAQQRLWFLAQLEGVSATYHIPMALRLRGPLDTNAWQQALDTLFARHEALRSTFLTVDGQAHVQLLDARSGLPMRRHDLRGVGEMERQAELESLRNEETYAPFDLVHGPLIRTRLIQLHDEEHVFLLTQHHIVSDGWSIGVMTSELNALYTAYHAAQPNPLPPLAIQYPDYAAWQRQWFTGDRLQAQADYWRATLADAPALLELPIDHPRDSHKQSFTGASMPFHIDATLTQALKHLSQRHGTTLFMTFLAAWSVVLARLSGQDDLVIGSPSANRGRHEIEPLIGFFVNTLALRLDLSGAPTVAELLRRVRQRALEAQDHQDLPFEQVVEIVQPPRRLEHTPIFQVMFAWQNKSLEHNDWHLQGLDVSSAEITYDAARFDLDLNLAETDDTILCNLRYASDIFDSSTIERQIGYLQTTLRAMVADDQQLIIAIDILAPVERELLLQTWNATDAPYPEHLCIHQLFEQQVERSPDAIALVYEEESLTYAELNARANRLAHHLIQLGVRPDICVAICVERSPAMVVGLLAILKAGGAYVPLDPAYPSERLVHILADAAPALVLADTSGRAALGEPTLAMMTAIDPNATLYHHVDTNPYVPGLTSRHLAYVIYTSGSTGVPKGPLNEHRGLINRLVWMQNTYQLRSFDRVLQKTPFSFDVSVWEFFWTLLNGATLVIAMPNVHKDVDALLELIIHHGITTIHFVPSMLHVFLQGKRIEYCTSLRRLICSGEVLVSTHVRLSHALLPNAQLSNLFGPTEAAIDVSAWLCPQDYTGDIIPIGRPISNVRIYLLNGGQQPVPFGAVGELYIGGVGVARGYLNQPELTAERFLPDPFSPHPGACMYRSGDLARYLPDGNLVFLGRNDHQVKIRGFRIEPGEIEARLLEHPEIRDAVVLALGDDTSRHLVAYVVAKQSGSLANSMREFLSARLPEYMVPAAFVVLDNLPLTLNGKLDRKALPNPDGEAFARQIYEAPQGENESLLATLWSELLGVTKVSRHDNFFALGGHSLLAIQMIERLHRHSLSLAVRDFFQFPILAGMALTLGRHHEVAVPPNRLTPGITAVTPDLLPLITLSQTDINRIVEQVPGGVSNIQDIYPLAPLQEGFLFHHLLAAEDDPYVLVSQIAFANRRLLDSYLIALQKVVDRHDILRTAFLWKDLTSPVQVVWREAVVPVLELNLNPAKGPFTEQLDQLFDLRHYPTDLAKAPLLQIVIANDPENTRWLVLQIQHHLIGDHTTVEIMQTEVQTFILDRGCMLPVAVPFRNFIGPAGIRIRQDEHVRFFTELLAEVDVPTLPFGLADVYRNSSRTIGSILELPEDLNHRLRSQAKRLGVSLASLCHLAWAQVLACITGQSRIVFGTLLSGRMQGSNGTNQAMGLFINTLPIRLDLDDTAVDQMVYATHARLAELLEHEHTPLAVAQRCSGVAAGVTLFSALLNYRHNTLPSRSRNIIGIQSLGMRERTNYPMTLSVDDFGDALSLNAQVIPPVDPVRVCGYMRRALESLTHALEQSPSMSVQQLEVVPRAECELLLQTWNETDSPYPEHLCIHQLFGQQVERSPDAIALVYEEESLTYAELSGRANRLAHHLIQLGVRPDTCVAICVERSPAMVVGLLAILKAGGAYVPLDPAYPTERLLHILADAAPALVLADTVGRAALGQPTLAMTTTIDPDATLYHHLDTNPYVPDLTSRHLAYVIYTSGSTGIPKGVMVDHYSLSNLASAQIAQFEVCALSRVLLFASISFDASVSEIVMALCSGGTLYLPSDLVRHDQYRLWNYMSEHALTHATLPPSLFQACENLPRISNAPIFIVAGDAPHAASLDVLRQSGRVFNAYGPTEGTVCTAAWLCPIDYTGDIIPIGRPISNVRIYLLNGRQQPVPLGAVGELCIGGVGVARGYLNQPELTAERFLPDPFSPHPGARMYRSGDLARYLPDGNLVFLGRNDHQVKIRGFRIEPGEIEARLLEHPEIRDAVVLALGDNTSKRLVAYVVAKRDGLLANSMREFLSVRLPGYMVPAAFVVLDNLPLTLNGKLDRKALPDPDSEAFARQIYEAPQGEIESTLATLWSELLGVTKVSRHDTFFALGGHSLLAVRLINRVATTWGVELPLASLFASASLAAFAAVIDEQLAERESRLAPIAPVAREGVLPLSFAQQRLWFLAQLEGVSATYHMPMALRLRGPLDTNAWQQALDTLFARHEALRSTFLTVDGQAHVQLLDARSGLPMRRHDLRGVGEMERQTELERLRNEETYAPFDLVHGPLIRTRLIQLHDEEHVFLFTQHHIVSDGWSLGVMTSELNALYTAYHAAQPNPLPPLAIQYPDYAAWQRQWFTGDRLQAQADYWRAILADAPALLELPIDRPRPPQQSFAGASMPFHIDATLTQALKHLSQRHGTTLFMTFLAAWSVVLARLSGQDDLVIGSPSANRGRHEIEPLIGFFVNTLALRLDLSGTPTVAELLRRVRQRALEAQDHQDFPFEQVVEIVQPTRRLDQTSLFQVMFAWQNNVRTGWQLPNLIVDFDVQNYDTARFDLDLHLGEANDAILGTFHYSTALFDQATIERHSGYLQTTLRAMVADDQQLIIAIDILAPVERELLLQTWNATDAPYPEHLCIHQLFEQQVERSPDAIALVYEEESLTYAELNARANRLAHHLIQLGVRPDICVAICVDRSPAMVVGLLAILKAGGAYVPLDPAYPSERLVHILADASPATVLVDDIGRVALGEISLVNRNVLYFNRLRVAWADCPDCNPDLHACAPTSTHLAYVIYTSGSTGVPKGIMVEHRSVVNFWHYMLNTTHQCFPPNSRIALNASFSFDMSLKGILQLLSGHAIIVIPQSVRLNGYMILDLLAKHCIDALDSTPSQLQMLLDAGLLEQKSPHPKSVLLGGEPIEQRMWDQLQGSVIRFYNMYGPTECTVDATVGLVGALSSVSIGKAISNSRIYLLDASRRLVPLGATGELYIGGVGVARGYLNQPELTAERFLPDPFSPHPGARMYRSGDLARYLPDGNLVFLGRNDHQVKIRGFRIEPGEIEARLLEHSEIRDAVVLALGDDSSKRLVAYVVRNEGRAVRDLAREVQQVTEWQAVYQAEYRKSRDDDWDEDFHGWISSYDGQAIPHKQMLEWQAATVNRLLELQPCHVLEIGVGGGLILSQLAPHCETYCGTDFSNEAIARLGAQIERHTNFDKRVSLVCQPAHLTKDLPIQRFDTIVLNSVVQYFPSAEYLIEVIQQAFSRLDPGGALFIGDIRSLPLLRCFASAVQFAKANEATDPIELQWAIDRQIKMDKELVLDPGFFVKLQHDIKDVAGVDIRVKRGRSSNELNRYRYDVVLYKSPIEIQSAMALPTISWDRNVNNLDILATYLGDTNLDGLRFCCVPNFHLIHEVKALELFRRKLPLASVLKQFRIAEDVPHPEDFHEIGAKFDFRVVVTWSGDSQNGDIDVLFLRRPLAFLTDVYRSTDNHQNTALLANEPYRLEDNRRLVADLEATLATQIPQYMVPAAFVVLDNLPLTLNGKLDRKALPDPDGEAFARQIYEAPQGEIESTLATLWSELLGVTKVSRHDTFFALGGHSLLAVRLINRVAKTWGVEPPLASLFASASLAAFAEVIGEQLKGQQDLLPPITPVAREGVLPLSFAQQRLWFLAQLEGVSATYHIPMALRLRGPLDTNAWQQALDTLFARHEALRSTFLTVDGQAHVQLLDARSGLPMRRHDLRGVGEMGRQAELERLRNEETYAPFDLVHGPLIRTRLIQLHDEEHVFLLTQHHIVSDGWSIGVMTSELNTLYTAYHAAQPNPLPPLAIQYPDYAAWQRQWFTGDRLQAQADYWRATLADAPALLELPIDHPRDSYKQSFTGASMPFHIDATLTQALKHLSQRHGTTLFMTFLAAWSVVLARLSGQDDLVIGSPSANRGRHEIEPLIGFFVNTLALRLDLSGAPTVAELLRRVRQRALEAQDHQDLPFEQVVEIVQPPRRLEHTPIFQVMFAWQNKSLEHNDWHLQGLDVSSAEITYDAAKFDLDLNLAETDDTILCNLRYASDIFDSSTIERQIGYLQTTLRAMVADDQQLIIAIDILAPVERELLLQTWNATDAPYPEHLCIHQLFEQQVERSPDAIALVYEEESLTYAELNARANRLAHHLIQLGVRPDICVAICVDRSPAMVVGLLAILKAGGAYVPLDPAYPSERLVHILADAAPALVLADTSGRAALGEPTLAMMTAIDPNATLYHHVDTNPYVPGLTSRHLAYVIYTSGSTGMPKGVMVEQKSLCNQIAELVRMYCLRKGDRILQFASIVSDMSVEEIFSSLVSGAALQIRTDAWLSSVSSFVEHCAINNISVVNLPSSYWAQLVTAVPEPVFPSTLRQIMVGGEQINSSAVRSWFARRGHRPTLFNAYGPTEATVNATLYEVSDKAFQQNIGRPISNTRVYLLDTCQRPSPRGVVGEIYIGGAGVARGYLNQPELTAERFLPDPFSPHPGARMYRSGDLARYLPDGNLVFLGRNDHQVKIRGFRIEPGEIEARLLEHPEIRDAVVLALGDNTSKRLVAYVVGNQDGSLANSMREFLSARLPEYMVPAAFVVLDNLPLTLNGKLDRKALPDPDGEAFARQIYEAPLGGIESTLATLWSELLGVTKVSRHDNFFALGGHSLLAIRAINDINKALNVQLTVRELFLYPVLRNLAHSIISANRIPLENVNLEEEAILDATIFAPQKFSRIASPKCIFLTGASGFLGTFLLRSLFNQTDAIIYCLVRSLDQTRGLQRIKDSFTQYGLINDYDPERVVAVPGDLSQPLFGLDYTQFDNLSQKVDVIYHNGAWVNFLHIYESLKATNVFGTQEVLRLASSRRLKEVHYISTLSVIQPALATTESQVLTEEQLIAHWRHLSSGYVQSKWVAERLLRIANSRGIPITIYRPPNIVGSTLTGASNINDIWSMFIDACLELNQVPNISGSINMLPVDYVSQCVVELSTREDVIGRCLNLINPVSTNLNQLTDCIASRDGGSIARIPYKEWLARCAAKSSTRKLSSILPDEITDTADVDIATSLRNGIHLVVGGTLSCPTVTAELLGKYVEWRRLHLTKA